MEAKAQILAMDTRRRLSEFQIPVSLLFTPKGGPATTRQQYTEIVTRVTREMLRLGLQTERQGGGDEHPFKLTNVVFHPWEFPVIFERGVGYVERFTVMALSRGISIPEIALKLSGSDRVALGRLLLTICRRHRVEREGNVDDRIRTAHVESLIVTMTTESQLVALCAAIAHSRSLSRLTTYAAMGGKRVAKWRALGFALLSHASRKSVRELSIQEAELLLSDIEAFAKMATSTNPHHALDPDTATGEIPRSVQLSEHAKIRLKLDGEECTLEHLQPSAKEYYHVVGDEEGFEWMKIFAPGYGVVHARCEDVVDVAFPTSQDGAPVCRLTHLHVAINKCEVGALIRAVGSSLESVDISLKHERYVQADDVRTILEACPRLKMLRLFGAKIGSMDVFTHAYEHGECQIASLVLKNVHVTNESLHDLAAALSDPSQRIAQTLTEFRFDFNQVGRASRGARPDLKGIKKFLNTLALNANLSFFELALDEPFYERFLERFQDRDGRLLVTHPAHLPLSAKLAFLSCIRVEESGSQTKKPRPLPREEGDCGSLTGFSGADLHVCEHADLSGGFSNAHRPQVHEEDHVKSTKYDPIHGGCAVFQRIPFWKKSH